MEQQASVSRDNEEGHHDSCTCPLCLKEKEIQEWKKQKINMHLQSMYRNDFIPKKTKTKREKKNKEQAGTQRKEASLDCYRAGSVQYLDLKSTYDIDFVSKKSELAKMKPMDNLGGHASFLPGSTTYMRSYQSTLMPKPDQPFKRIEMPVGANGIPFSSQSVYQKAYKREYSPKPNLPFIHRQALSKPKSIGVFESTTKNSYSTLNPESSIKQIINLKPSGNLINLKSFAHNYDTTYRNFFVASSKKIESKHTLDEMGNVNSISRRNRAPLF